MLNPLTHENRKHLHPAINIYDGACILAQTVTAGYVAGKLFARLSNGTGFAMGVAQAPILFAHRFNSNLDPEGANTNIAKLTVFLSPLLARFAGYRVSFGEMWRYIAGSSVFIISSNLVMSQVVDRVFGSRFTWLRKNAIAEWATRPAALEKIDGIALSEEKVSEPPPLVVLDDMSLVNLNYLTTMGGDYYENIARVLVDLNADANKGDAYAEFGRLMRNLTAKLQNLPKSEQKTWAKELDDAFMECGSQWQQVAERIYLRLTIPGGSVASIMAEHNHDIKKRIIASWTRINPAYGDVHLQHTIQKRLQPALGLRFMGNDDPEAVANAQLQRLSPFAARFMNFAKNAMVEQVVPQFEAIFRYDYTAERLVKEHLALWGDGNQKYKGQFFEFLKAELAKVAPQLSDVNAFAMDEFLDEDYKLNKASIIFALKRTGHLVNDGVIVHGKKNEAVLPASSDKGKEEE
jgi:hypothetical protein